MVTTFHQYSEPWGEMLYISLIKFNLLAKYRQYFLSSGFLGPYSESTPSFQYLYNYRETFWNAHKPLSLSNEESKPH